MGLSCEQRTRHVHYGPLCVTAFLSCCHLSEALTREAREEQLLLGTSEGATAGACGVGEGAVGQVKGRDGPWREEVGG